MSQCAQSMNLQAILAAIVAHLQTSVAQEKLTAQRVRQVTTTICKVQEYVRVMSRMNIDDREFAYLKTIALFGTGEQKLTLYVMQVFLYRSRLKLVMKQFSTVLSYFTILNVPNLSPADQLGITCPKQIDKLKNKTVIELREYCARPSLNASPAESESRFSNLLLRLAPLRSLQPDVLEELFFAGLIGNVQIDSVVPYILKMETSEYQAQFGTNGEAENGGEKDAEEGKTKHSFLYSHHIQSPNNVLWNGMNATKRKKNQPSNNFYSFYRR